MNKDYLKLVDSLPSTNHGVDSTFSCSGDNDFPMQTRICFGVFTKSFTCKRKVDITVRMFKDIRMQGTYRTSKGLTPFTCDEIIQYLNDLRKIFPFEFEVQEKEITDNPFECLMFSNRLKNKTHVIDVTYHIDGPHIAYMFILSLQRFLYAFGDVYYLALAFEIKNGGYGFEKMNLFNILNCVISTVHCRFMGGDMYHLNPERFVYLLNSKDFRDMLLAREKMAQEQRSACADLYQSMPYINDSRLERMPINGAYRFPGFRDGQEDELKKIIEKITSNLKVLREYNGFGDKAKMKRTALEQKAKSMRPEDMNAYREDNHEQCIKVKTHIDETKLAE